ncbi:SOS response-associated peptidase family protein [Mitsuaria sp. WAJ17]|uniref:SOS response-associated peptidase n=1 Tax=Mitsuaria sp. WAJ17 TaxID=2761452 RepID=UPI001603017B|nr:SOS response-associated peptidase family protein [Mitsuaria sp. WAJ17]MBB2486319.1 SOS response-associated peptidase family protein [Mitsuaria sp. WAJ17]
MCNLYHVSPKGDIFTYFRTSVPDPWLDAPVVGPFGQGVFLRSRGRGLDCVLGQWGLIRPGQPERIERLPSKVPGKQGRPRSTNNARIEGIEKKVTFRAAWAEGRRCIIPAAWYQEPNWETGKNIWWQLRRANGLPWALAGLWSEWVDPATGEVVPNFTMITTNCDQHPLLNRLHKPDPDLAADAQDKRSLVHLEPGQWETWLHGSIDQALAMIKPAPAEMFDLADARRTDQLLTAR